MLATQNNPESIQDELRRWYIVEFGFGTHAFVNPDKMYVGRIYTMYQAEKLDLPFRIRCVTALAKIPYGPDLIFVTDTPEGALALVRDTPTHVLRALAKIAPDSYIPSETTHET